MNFVSVSVYFSCCFTHLWVFQVIPIFSFFSFPACLSYFHSHRLCVFSIACWYCSPRLSLLFAFRVRSTVTVAHCFCLVCFFYVIIVSPLVHSLDCSQPSHCSRIRFRHLSFFSFFTPHLSALFTVPLLFWRWLIIFLTPMFQLVSFFPTMCTKMLQAMKCAERLKR